MVQTKVIVCNTTLFLITFLYEIFRGLNIHFKFSAFGIQFFRSFQTNNLDVDMVYTKVIVLNTIYNFIFDKFLYGIFRSLNIHFKF